MAKAKTKTKAKTRARAKTKAPARRVKAAAKAKRHAPARAAKPAVPFRAPARPANKSGRGFSNGDYVVYPKHGVGRVVGIEDREISGAKLELYVVRFEKERMTLRVPVTKAEASGMRKLSNPAKMDEAFMTLKGKARIKRTMWSRRAQEYEAKINSGDLVSIAEVVRDLHRKDDQPEQSYSERQIYEAALSRLARELAAVEAIDETEAMTRLEKVLVAA